jgi:ankyrin repeat protein
VAVIRQNGTETSKFSRVGRSPLFYAVIEGRAGDVAAYLQDHGHEVNSVDGEGLTPLHFAAQHQHADVAAVLIETGADLHARDRFGRWR